MEDTRGRYVLPLVIRRQRAASGHSRQTKNTRCCIAHQPDGRFSLSTTCLVDVCSPATPSRPIQVDVLSKLPKTEFNQKLAATKWSEILEGLNIAVDLIGPVPKLTAGDYGDLIHKVKRLGDHSHVQVRRTVGKVMFNLSA